MVTGCSVPRTMLYAPHSDAPFESRRIAYEHLTPVGTGEVIFINTRTFRTSSETFLRLRGGDEIWAPEDLLPVVHSNSITAQAVRESVHENSEARRYGWLGNASLYMSPLGIIGGGIGAANASDDAGVKAALGTGLATSGALGITGWVLGDDGATNR